MKLAARQVMVERSEYPLDRRELTPRVLGRYAAAIEIALRLSPGRIRSALATLFALDARFADILATTSEPMIGQLRLAWWRDALIRLDTEPAPAEPLLQKIQRDVLTHGVVGGDLAAMTEGWDALTSGNAADLQLYAEQRGMMLFSLSSTLLGGERNLGLAAAGRGWALSQIPVLSRDRALGDHARVMARAEFNTAFAQRWPARIRPLGVIALLARFDLEADPSRLTHLGILIRFRLTGC